MSSLELFLRFSLILSFLAAGCPPCANDSNRLGPIHMHNNQQSSRSRDPRGHEAHLAYRVKWICDRGGERIAEYSRRLIERDSMLDQVPRSLKGIPVELHASIILPGPPVLLLDSARGYQYNVSGTFTLA